MLYVTDITRMHENLLGIINTDDNTFNYEDISSLSDKKVYGYSKGNAFSCVPYSENEVIYLGDYIAPPVSSVGGRLYELRGYRLYNSRAKSTVFYYPIFYIHNNVESYSVAKLVITVEFLKKCAEVTGQDYKNYTNCLSFNEHGTIVDYTVEVENLIRQYFMLMPIVEVTLEVLSNIDKLSEVLGVNIEKYVTMNVLNADVIVESNVRPLIFTGISNDMFIDITVPPVIRSSIGTDKSLLTPHINEYLSNATCSDMLKEFWLHLMSVISEKDNCSNLLQSDLTYSQLTGTKVKLNSQYIFGVKSASYCLSSFVSPPTAESLSIRDRYWNILESYFPNKVKYIREAIRCYTLNRFEKTDNFAIYTTLRGVFLVKEKSLDLVKKREVTQFDKIKGKLRLVSDTIKIDKVTNSILYLTLVVHDARVAYDIEGVLKEIDFGTVTKLSIAFTEQPKKPFRITIPKGITSVEPQDSTFKHYTPDEVFMNSAIVLKTTSKTEVKRLLNNKFLQNLAAHVFVNKRMRLVTAETLLVMNYSSHYVHSSVQRLFDYYNCMSGLSVEKQQEIIKTIERRCGDILNDKEFIRYDTVNKPLIVMPSKVVSTLSTHNLIDSKYKYYNLSVCGMKVTLGATLSDTAYIFMELVSNVLTVGYELSLFIKTIFNIYMKLIYSLEDGYNFMINNNAKRIIYNSKSNKFEVLE